MQLSLALNVLLKIKPWRKMMKKRTMIGVTILLLTMPMMVWASKDAQTPTNEPSTAENGSTISETSLLGENYSLTASFKIWRTYLKWDSESTDIGDSTSYMFGPAFNLTYREKFYCGISYYRGSGFDLTFNDNNDVDVEATKTDFDLWVGYSFNPRGSAFIGYKNTKLEIDFSGPSGTADVDGTFKGPVLGVTGNYPINESNFILFGTFGYAFLNAEIETSISDQTEDEDYNGPAIEFGVSYILPNLPKLSLTGGYKYQDYEADKEEITFSGFTFGANYRL
jgi:hypothetical protein